ncbi:MAG: DegV family protein [Eubacteriales bacterium]
MNIIITTDSTCDLPAALVADHQIYVFPLYVVRDGKAYRDGLEIRPQDIFDHVSAGGDLCTTSAVNLADYMTKFGEFSRRYDAVIHLNITAESSCCHQNALLAAADYPNVYVVDSRNLTCGHGALVLMAKELANEGMRAEEIVEAVKANVDNVHTSFLLNQLEYLRRGGRCSTVAALGANLLKLKPVIELKQGKMAVGKKYRGDFEKNIPIFLRDHLEGVENLDLRRIYLGCVGLTPEMTQLAKTEALKLADFQEVVVYEPGCTITCHCGPGTLGLVFLTK